MKKEVRRQLVEHAKTMVFTSREAHRALPGRVRERLFSGARCEGASRGVRRGTYGDFWGFLGILGVPCGSIFDEQMCFFGGPIFSPFLRDFWEGPAAGAGLPEVSRICRVWLNLVTP